MTEIPYEIELDEVQWRQLKEALADGGCVTFCFGKNRIAMENGK